MEPKTKGAWLVHHTNKLNSVTDHGAFGQVKLAGKSAILLAALAQDSQASLSYDQAKMLAVAAQIDPVFEFPVILERLEKEFLISRGNSGIDVLGITTSTALEHAAQIYDASGAGAQENASLIIAEQTSVEPRLRSSLAEEISDQFSIPISRSTKILTDSETIGFVDSETLDPTTSILFNGNLFRRDALQKTTAVLDSLNDSDRQHVLEVDELLISYGCLPRKTVDDILGETLLKKLVSIGMYDLNEVKNPKETTLFITKPSAFNKYGDTSFSDAFDLAKAFVACLSYGINYRSSSTGKIRMIEALLRKLIRGEWVGPATAIGEDYRILEVKHVIAVRKEGHRFSMKLLKRDVGELALQVLTEGDASEQSLSNLPGAMITGYVAPEENRVVTRKKQQVDSSYSLGELLLRLRTAKA